MQLIVDIENENVADKVVQFLKSLKKEGVKVTQQETTKNHKPQTEHSDEYIEENWQNVVSEALAEYDSDYEKSFEYKIDRADFQDIKGKI